MTFLFFSSSKIYIVSNLKTDNPTEVDVYGNKNKNVNNEQFYADA